jgi:hypothetical protein
MENFIIIKKIGEKDFVMIDGEKSINIEYEIHEEKVSLKSGEKINHWILIPENSINRKGFRLEDFDGEISEKKYFERKKSEISGKSEKSKKSEEEIFKWEDFISDEEKKIIEDIKKKAEERIQREKERRENPKYQEMISVKKKFDELIKIGFISENSEDYIKICEMIKNFQI